MPICKAVRYTYENPRTLPEDGLAANVGGNSRDDDINLLYKFAVPRDWQAQDACAIIAATAAANGLPLYTRNAADFSALKRIVTIVAL
jgi:hypothetical protein